MTDTTPHSDALVFYGVTGDLAYKQIFPALQSMIKHGHLSIPIIGVAGRPWSIDQLRAHLHDGLEEHGGVDPTTFKKLSSMLQYVSGDYKDETTYANRGKFYEVAGAVRDVAQNHMLQLVALLAMEPPAGNYQEAIRDEKARIFKAMRPIDPSNYAPNTWGPPEADRIIEHDGGWYNPVPTQSVTAFMPHTHG